jgi:hypothetical protein
MIRQTSLALATGLLMVGITAASAVPALPGNTSDVLNLTVKQPEYGLERFAEPRYGAESSFQLPRECWRNSSEHSQAQTHAD